METSRIKFLVLASSLVAAAQVGIARADNAEDVSQTTLKLVAFDLAIDQGQQLGDRAESSFQEDAAGCTAVVAKLKELGVAPTQVIEGKKQFLFKQAAQRCEEYGRWKQLIGGAIALREASNTLGIVNGFEPGKVGDVWMEKATSAGKACAKGVDAALAAGAPADVKVKVFSNTSGQLELTLGEGKQQVCEPLLGWGKGYAQASNKAKAANEAALRDKYGKHGIKGDRLKLFMEYDDVYWRGKGCEKVDDVAALAKMPVLFQWLEDSGGTHTIRRYQFKGDKLVKTTNKTFKTEAAAYRGCK